jgi:hypothetical protein
MTFRQYARVLCAAAVLGTALATAAGAQTTPAKPPQPTPAALLMARELIELKGASKTYDPLLYGVIEYHKNFFVQNNPNMGKDLDVVAKKLLADLAPRKAEMQQEIARIYAEHFTEQELKDALTFFKTPLGRKLIVEEPKVLDESLKAADDWSRKFAEEVVVKFRAEMKARGHNLM